MFLVSLPNLNEVLFSVYIEEGYIEERFLFTFDSCFKLQLLNTFGLFFTFLPLSLCLHSMTCNEQLYTLSVFSINLSFTFVIVNEQSYPLFLFKLFLLFLFKLFTRYFNIKLLSKYRSLVEGLLLMSKYCLFYFSLLWEFEIFGLSVRKCVGFKFFWD